MTRAIRKAYDELQKQYEGRTVVNGVTQDQAAALQGNSGTPSDSNRYLTELDGASYVVGPASAVDSNLVEFDTTTGKLVKDGLITHASVASAVSASHARSHAIDGTSDHTIGSLTNTYLVKSDGSKLAPATNTDAQVSGAVTNSHVAVTVTAPIAISTQAISLVNDAVSPATITAFAIDGTFASNSDALVPTQKAAKTYADTKTTLAAVKADADVASAISLKHTQGTDTGTSNATFAIGSLKFYGLSTQLADTATVVLTTATANYPAHGFVQVSTTGVIAESAEFEMGSDGNVNIIRGTANIVANANTTAKFCLGTAASQNPLTIKNYLGATVQAIIEFRCR